MVDGRDRAAACLSEGDDVKLRREPDNKYDENAVAIYSPRGKIGYIPAKHAFWVARAIDSGKLVRVTVREISLRGWIAKRAEFVYLTIETGSISSPPALAKDEQEFEEEKLFVERLASDGICVLRFIALASAVPSEIERKILSEYVCERVGKEMLRAGGRAVLAFVTSAMDATIPRARAQAAARKIAANDDHVELLLKSILALVKADGVLSEEEQSATKSILGTLRRARKKAGLPTG